MDIPSTTTPQLDTPTAKFRFEMSETELFRIFEFPTDFLDLFQRACIEPLSQEEKRRLKDLFKSNSKTVRYILDSVEKVHFYINFLYILAFDFLYN